MPRTVLLTAFEPFGGDSTNPSIEVVDRVRAAWDRDERLLTAVLPVSFAGADRALTGLLDRHAPDVVVSVGLAGGRAQPGLERVALNLCDARIADNDGDRPSARAVLADGPLALATTIPVKAAWRRLHAEGVAVELSTTAGTFVCNAVFYRAADWAARHDRRAGFVHVPRDRSADGVRAVRASVDAALDVAVDDDVPAGSLD